jgi:hypothetical protein
MNKGEERYRAVVESTRTVGFDGVLDRIRQHGSSLSSGEVLAAWHGIKTAVASLMIEGVNVNTDLFNCSVSIRGNFDDAMDHFDKKRHKVHPVVNAGTWLKDTLSFHAKVVKKEARIPGPNLTEYQGCNSGRSNRCLTPGGMGRLLGSHLKVDPDDPEQGLFFIAKDGQTTRVEVLAKNVYSELIFLIPAGLSPGTYRLQVRALFNQSDLRADSLGQKLTVTA